MDDAEGGEEPMDDEPMDDEPMDDAGAEGEPVDTGIGDEAGLDDEEELGDELGDEEFEDDEFEGEEDLEVRLDSLEDKLDMIMDKLGIEEPAVDADAYDDDDLFGDEEGDEDFGDEDEFGDEGFEDEEPEFGGEDLGGEGEVAPDEDYEDEEDEYPMESRRRRGGVQIFETRAFKRAMRNQRINEEGMTPFTDNGRVPSGNMNKLDDFGKHPAYQKVVMDLPPKDMKEFPGNYDMNDDSVKNDTPYGEKIGDGAPFDIDPESIDNAIAEAFDRLKKKGNRA
jgi:hypothetical protein